ncbi:MAG: hypothetical protein ACOX9E_14100, partial [Lentisphaeria bacterium]
RRGFVFLVPREVFLSADVADCRRLWRHGLPLRVKPRRWVVFLVSCEGFLSADVADCRRLWRHVLPLRVKPRRRVFSQIGAD